MKRPRIALTLTLLLAAGWAAAQEAPPGALPGIFSEVLDVRVVNLEVVVTDKDGIPVVGLSRDDFRLLIDGEPVPIDYFTEVRGGVAIEREGGGAGVPAIAPGEPVGTSYLLFIDEVFSVGTDRNRVLEAMIEDLPLLGPEDRMAVVAYNGDELEMLTTWSQSVPALERVLKRARSRQTYGLQRAAERRQLDFDEDVSLQDIFGDAGFDRPIFQNSLDPRERAYVQRLSEQLDRTVAAAAATLRSFGQPPGRKVMLLLSGGWPYFPTEFLLGDFRRAILDREGLEGEDLYGRLVDTANLLGYTLYPVDVPGMGRELVDVSRGELDPGPVIGGGSLLREQEQHYTLSRLAEKTGGRALINARRLDAFAAAVSDTRAYYWIGFTPARSFDDERHEVRIETVAGGFEVRSRAGFLDTSRQREVTMAVESALLFGNSPTEGALEVKLGELRKAGRGKMEVPLEVVIPLDQVTFLPLGEAWGAGLELRVAVKDDKGRRAEIPVIPIQLQVPEEPAAGSLGRYETTLRLRREPHEAVVAVFDPASGRILSAGLTIAP